MSAFSFMIRFFLLLIFAFLQPGQAKGDSLTLNQSLSRETDEYKSLTYDNMSKMYWAIGKFKFDDLEAIDGYLQINECELYKTYYKNEFAWAKIREAARQEIISNLAFFPTRFEIILPITLGEYDIEEKIFWLKEGDAPLNVTKVALGSYHPGKVCVRTGELPGYPTGLIINFNRPFSLPSIPVGPELARLYLDDIARQQGKYERSAYLRVKVKFAQYKEDQYALGYTKAVVFAKLEGYEVYADPEKLKLLHKEDFRDKRIRKVKRRRRARGISDLPAQKEEGAQDKLEEEADPS